ncbi:MAG: hypothetical protein JO142_05660 [Burkholderiales bacterium]|nr:hypothetical protein [Burkholderiales bacterium]
MTSNAALPATPAPASVVTVHFDYYRKDRAQVRLLEHRLEKAIKAAGVGELGETELHEDGNDGYLYLYGADTERLYAVASPILKASRLMAGAEVTEREGEHRETFTIRRGGTR